MAAEGMAALSAQGASPARAPQRRRLPKPRGYDRTERVCGRTKEIKASRDFAC